ncbi:hypothetical protein ACHAPJ_006548 [Fusarium lateritium]
MQFDYYHKSPVDTEDFKNYYKFARTVATEDNELCEKVQMNLNVGIYLEGTLNPYKENGVIRYQRRVFEMCLDEFNKTPAADDKKELLGSGPGIKVSSTAAEGIV